jgi:hypothetical protein
MTRFRVVARLPEAVRPVRAPRPLLDILGGIRGRVIAVVRPVPITTWIIIVVAVLVVAGGVYFFFIRKK